MVVVDEFDRAMPNFTDQLVEKSVLKPDLVVCLNPLENYVMLHECGLAGIPTIGIIDTDANPTWVTYPIPANDDSIRSVQVIAGVLGRAGQEGQNRRKQAALEGRVTYSVDHGLQPPTGQENEIEAEHRRIISEARKEFAAAQEEGRAETSHASEAELQEDADTESQEDADIHDALEAAKMAAGRSNPAGQQMGVNLEDQGPQEELEEEFTHKISLDEAGAQVRENK